MKFRIDRLFYTIVLLLFCSSAFAQPYKTLTINDFRNASNSGGDRSVASTYCTIEYSFTARPENDYYMLTFYVKLVMDNNQSWMDLSKMTSKEMLAEILKHEQGHYNISYMEQQELLRTVAHTVFRSDYKRVANAIFDRIEAKYKLLNQNYDADTKNSTDREQQRSWDAYFQQKLAYMPLAKN